MKLASRHRGGLLPCITNEAAMPAPFRSLSLAIALALPCLPAAAAALHCASVNGNVTCSRSDAASCQTVDGRTVCVGGNGAVTQSFGGPPDDDTADDTADTDETEAPSPPPNRSLNLRRDGTRLHLQTDRLRIDKQ